MQQPQQPTTPPPQQQRMMLPPPQAFVGAGLAGMPTGGFGAAAAAAVAAARARAAEQMAYEDACKVLNPDFLTSFASVEDAVSRLLPYHVFADSDEDDGVNGDGTNCSSDATETVKSSAQKSEDGMNATKEYLLAEFEKQVLTFNLMTRQRAEGFSRGEERLMLERALFEDERRLTEQVRAAAVAQRQQQEQEEAERARLALAHAHAQAAAGAWHQVQVQPSTPSWQQALAAAAAARGQGSSGGQATVPAMMMQQLPSPHQQQQQQEMTMTAGAWQVLAASRGEGFSGGQPLMQAVMMQQLQQQQQQQLEMILGGQVLTPAMAMQLLHQQQQEMMAAGTWQLGGRQGYMMSRDDGSSSSQAGAVLQQHPGQGQAATMALPWRSSAERSEQ